MFVAQIHPQSFWQISSHLSFMSHNPLYVLCSWRDLIPTWSPLALPVQFLLSLHWHPLYCLLRHPYQTGHPWALSQLILSYRALQKQFPGVVLGTQFQTLPLFFWLGCALGKRNLGSSFPPHLQWFAQTDISNLSKFGQIFQAPVLNWPFDLPCEVAEVFSKGWSPNVSNQVAWKGMVGQYTVD